MKDPEWAERYAEDVIRAENPTEWINQRKEELGIIEKEAKQEELDVKIYYDRGAVGFKPLSEDAIDWFYEDFRRYMRRRGDYTIDDENVYWIIDKDLADSVIEVLLREEFVLKDPGTAGPFSPPLVLKKYYF